MGIRVLANEDDDMAAMYHSATDWAFGPVVYTQGSRISAAQLMEKFITWAGLRERGPFQDWSDVWLQDKWSTFYGMAWHHCETCSDELVPATDVDCPKCMRTCEECADSDVDTEPKAEPGKRARRLCEECRK